LRLDGNVAVVTGAGQGIGEAFPQALGEAGPLVIATDVVADRVAARPRGGAIWASTLSLRRWM
jgi:NAD(P)-dependent dehydrogenase (short-subunit alcohol dehydrogenase family)